MIERYSGAGRFTVNNDGQWVSYEKHLSRMKQLMEAIQMVRKRDESGDFFNQTERDTLDNAFYAYCDEVGMGAEEEVDA
jgi:hypothetical protein